MNTPATPSPTTTLKPCAGKCGKTLRPHRAKAADYPGTVRAESRGMCQPCNTRLPKAPPPPPSPHRDQCRGCKRTMRPRGTARKDYPGTVVAYTVDQCKTCHRYEQEGHPPRYLKALKAWEDCKGCHRPMRPRNVRAAAAPGTVRTAGDGRCVTCKNRAEHPERTPQPLVIGGRNRPVVRQTTTRPRPGAHRLEEGQSVARVVDPNLERFLAASRARRAAEAARKARLARIRTTPHRQLVPQR